MIIEASSFINEMFLVWTLVEGNSFNLFSINIKQFTDEMILIFVIVFPYSKFHQQKEIL